MLTSDEHADPQTFDKREVKTGLSDGVNIEIAEGLDAETAIRGAKADPKASK